jgi:hypothetical protein
MVDYDGRPVVKTEKAGFERRLVAETEAWWLKMVDWGEERTGG